MDYIKENFIIHNSFYDIGKQNDKGIQHKHAHTDIRQYHAMLLGFQLFPEEPFTPEVPDEPLPEVPEEPLPEVPDEPDVPAEPETPVPEVPDEPEELLPPVPPVSTGAIEPFENL